MHGWGVQTHNKGTREGAWADLSNGFDYPEQAEVDKYYPQFYHRTDKDGRPIYIEQLGKLDINKLYALTTQERQLKHLVSEYEKFLKDRLPACSAESGHLVETSCTILDLYNAGISSFYRGEWEGVNPDQAAGGDWGDRLTGSEGLRFCGQYYRTELLWVAVCRVYVITLTSRRELLGCLPCTTLTV